MWILALTAGLAASPDPLLSALADELEAADEAWSEQDDAPYYLAYRAVEMHRFNIGARFGALARSTDRRNITLDVTARVGSPELDSTHPMRDESFFDRNWHRGFAIAGSGPPEAIRATIWEASNIEIRDAQEAWHKLQTDQRVKVDEADDADDFSAADPVVDLRDRAAIELDRGAWEEVLVEVSAALDSHPDIHQSQADLHAVAENHYLATSEGTQIRHPRSWLRVSIQTRTRAEDGMDIRIYRWKDVHDPAALPNKEDLLSWADSLVEHTIALREAPLGEPYDGPILFRGPAAGVFIHEVIGHRVEGHRQKDEDEGQTFKDKVGTKLLPDSISIYDDPSIEFYAGEALNGYYAYDQEGQPAQRAWIVRDGVFEGFLMSRSPIDIDGFEHSNGHGRAATLRQPTSRMANTIVASNNPVPFAELRKRLLDEVREQGRDHGLIIDELAGGFTLTGRVFPNTFNIRATYGWKVYTDGRPDELIRGIDLVGTPLVALSSVVAAGDDPGVFNGFCGAESGSVPNAAVSPSLLIRQLEIQKKETGSDRPPLLPKPKAPGSGT